MRAIIIEDEPFAANKLKQMLEQIKPDIQILNICHSVGDTIDWLNRNEHPDLGFFDIQLGDGTSFDVFEKCQIQFPVIFTTAYDNFAIKAFKVNSIDYLLKPIDESELIKAIYKFEHFYQPKFNASLFQSAIHSTAKMILDAQKFKERFTVFAGEHLRIVKTEDIALFFSEEKSTYLTTSNGKIYFIDQTLNQLEDNLDPASFFRASRKNIVNLNFISDIVNYGRSRYKIIVETDKERSEIMVSRDKTKRFKEWLNNDR